MGLGHGVFFPFFCLLVWCHPGAGEAGGGAPPGPERLRLTLLEIDYGTGTVHFRAVEGSVSAGEILEASSALGTLRLRVLAFSGEEGRAAAEDPDLLAVYRAGGSFEVERAGKGVPGDAADRLLEELESFDAEIGTLIGESTEERAAARTRLPRPRRGGWRGDAGVRVGYERFRRSGAVIPDLDPNDRESVERGLAELEELIRRAREVPGIDQSDLDRAEELAAETRAILDDPAGDLETAAGNIIAAQIIVDAAIERAGEDPDAIRVRDFEDEVEETVEEYAFVNLRRDFAWGEEGEIQLDEHLEGGSRFLNEVLRLRAERPIARAVRIRMESDTDLRLYRKDFADDVMSQGLDAETAVMASRQLELAAGGSYYARREFNTFSDDGYQSAAPRVEGRYRAGRWGWFEGTLAREYRWYNASANRDLDQERDIAELGYTYIGPGSLFSLTWDRLERDADLPEDEDDYTENVVTGSTSRRWGQGFTTGIEGRAAKREYTTTGGFDPDTGTRRGDDNTDYDLWSVRPFVEIRWSDGFSTTLDYEYVRVENEDRVPEDDIEKSLGDYDLHRAGLGVQWEPHPRWEVYVRQEIETRNHPNGETGKLETWFADFRHVADYDAYTVSGLLVHHITAAWDAELDLFHTRERYPTFSELDSDQTSVQLLLRYYF